MATITPGKRLYPNAEGHLILRPGEYGKDNEGHWWCRPPRGDIGTLDDHEVVEHDDHTITVRPSILLEGVWHGSLTFGIWEEV